MTPEEQACIDFAGHVPDLRELHEEYDVWAFFRRADALGDFLANPAVLSAYRNEAERLLTRLQHGLRKEAA